MLKKVFAAFIVLMTIMLGACSSSEPTYQTRNTYTDPDTPQGKLSSLQCQMAQSQCEQIAEMKQEACVQKKDSKLVACRAKQDGDLCLDFSTCSVDKTNCEKQYAQCFQVAGGKVKLETVCVKNCEHIKP